MKVSICIPAYKYPHFLKRCIDSILVQDFKDYELIITDDSPDDALEKLVLTYNDDRIHYNKNEKPLGSPRNWNECIKKAKGEYIKILHHDDWLATNESLTKYVALLDNNPDANIAFSGCYDIKENGDKKLHIAKPSFLKELEKEPEVVYKGNQLGAPSVCIFRNHRNYFFDTQLVWLVDTDFYIRVISENNKFIYSTEILVNIGISEHQITRQCMDDILITIKENIYVFYKFRLEKKSSTYRHKLVRILGRNKIFSDLSLKKSIPDTRFRMTKKDSLLAYYYFIKKRIGNIIRPQ